jgi:YVTN family beta-propeller protein
MARDFLNPFARHLRMSGQKGKRMKPQILRDAWERMAVALALGLVSTLIADPTVAPIVPETISVEESWVSPIVAAAKQAPYDSPAALAGSQDGKHLFVACATANQVAVFDTEQERITARLAVPDSPTGLALSKDGSRLYVTCAAPLSTVCVIDTIQQRISARLPVGHTATAPVLSPDGQMLYVCNRFDDDISVIDLNAGCTVQRVPVEREPVAAAITPDGHCLVVANHLHSGPANSVDAMAGVSMIDTQTRRVTKTVALTLGSSLLRGVAISPDGRFAAVTHLRSMFWLTTSGIDLGRMNCNALTVLNLNRARVLGTLLLDQTARGAANPWAVLWTPDGKTIAVSHAGSHEVSIIDAPVEADSWSFLSLQLGAYAGFGGRVPEPPRHPVRVRDRVALPGNGPRAMALVGTQLYVANYFSDDLCRIDLATKAPTAELLPLGPTREPDIVRKGEMLFNDGRLCAQSWQSCASCHDPDGRTDALNWDLLNDGVGNPKNTKSLVWAHHTAPAMALGVRTNAETAVRAGIHHILFSEQPEDVPLAMDAYLASLQPVASPRLVHSRLSAAAARGEQLFMSAKTGCADCHPPPLFTDLAGHDVGTAAVYESMWGNRGSDKPTDRFDTPTLVELWRTAPYLHDGSAKTVRDVLSTHNHGDRHGRTSHLSEREIDDLIEYLLSL